MRCRHETPRRRIASAAAMRFRKPMPCDKKGYSVGHQRYSVDNLNAGRVASVGHVARALAAGAGVQSTQLQLGRIALRVSAAR